MAGGWDMDPKGLLCKELKPASAEILIPPTGGVFWVWGADGHSPAEVVGWVHPRGKRLVNVLRLQPA